MEFVIRKNSTLPLLKMQVVKDGRGTYEDFMSFIETSTIYFSMQNIDNGVVKINTAFAGFVEKTFVEPNATPEYYLYYRFSKKDTNRVGRFEGQFLLKNPTGTLVLPIREKLIINVKDSIFEDELDYSECFVGKYECCIIGPPSNTTPTQTPTNTITPTQTPTNTPTNSETPTNTPTNSETPTNTPTKTPTNTQTPTYTPSVTNTITISQTPTLTTSETPTYTPSITPTLTTSNTPTNTPTITPTSQSEFRSIWTANSPISLPYSPTGTYSGTIDWGDGSVSANTYDNRTHNYVSSGDYLITITGVIEGFNFGQYGNGYNESIKEILSFGPLKVESVDFSLMFSGCTNLTLSAVTDTLDTSYGVVFDEMFVSCTSLTSVPNMGNWIMSAATSMTLMFNFCSQFNENLNNWDVSNVGDITGMFLNASSFNQPLSGWNTSLVGQMVGVFENASSFNQNIGMWNISSVIDMSNMLNNTNINIDNYSNILIGWSNQIPSIQNNVVLGASNLIYSASTAQFAKNSLTGSPYNWIINDSGSVGPLPSQTPTPTLTPTPTITPSVTVTPNLSPDVTPTNTITPTSSLTYNPFVSIWSGGSVTLPYVTGGTYSGTIDWGDGLVSANTYNNRTHTYSPTGTYTITIDGEITGFEFNIFETERLKILEINSWGQLKGANNSNKDMFNYCENLVLTGVTNVPNLSGITAMTSMFASCSKITTINNLNSWDMSGVKMVNAMFDSCDLFNQDISGWNVSNVTNMSGLFAGCLTFNQNINNWVTSAVTSLNGTFTNATLFNQPLSGWNVSNVTNMQSLFNGCSNFNQNINNWVTSAVTTLNTTFNNAALFNQPLSGWNVSNVTGMTSMLSNSGLDVNNYSNILIGWSNQIPSIQNNVVLGAAGLKYYSYAQSSKNILTGSPYNWVITDSGQL